MIWKNSWLDSLLLSLSLAQFVITWQLAVYWPTGSFALLVAMMVYNIIVISHLFTHTSWFVSERLNSLVSIINSINIGQSVQAYRLTHVRNHHRYDNDQQNVDGLTMDTSSTFRYGKNNEHASLFQYAFVGALRSLRSIAKELLFFWQIDQELYDLMPKTPQRRAEESLQLRLDRIAQLIALLIFISISWRWTLFCYLPAFYLALALVNIQNYYEHYGANPKYKTTNSVSYYGRIYNLLAFNDGHHQEHHLRPGEHWTAMPQVRVTYAAELTKEPRIISPVPAIIGFLDQNRKLLHRENNNEQNNWQATATNSLPSA